MPGLLITGGAGFIGVNFLHYRLSRHPKDHVVVLDALTYAGNKNSLKPAFANPYFTFVHDTITNQKAVEELLRTHEIDTVVHFAAESHVDRSITGPDIFIETNVTGTHSLLKAARTVWLEEQKQAKGRRFHHVSTDEVFGSLLPGDPAFTEKTAYAPSSPYAASKAASDHLVRAYAKTYGLPVSISNCSNNYGPCQFPEKLIPLVLINILHNKPLPLYGDGQQIRDWLYVTDHCRAIERIITSDVEQEYFNIGGENECTNRDIVHTICRLMDEHMQDSSLQKRFPEATAAMGGNSASLIEFVKDRPGHDVRYAINPQKAREVLGYRPQETLATGLAKTINWYLKNKIWWEKVMDGSYRKWIQEQYSG